MSPPSPLSSWLDFRDAGIDPATAALTVPESSAFVRLWQGFMTARVALALVMLSLQLTVYLRGAGQQAWLVALCGVHVVLALWFRQRARPCRPGRAFDSQWLAAVGLDMVVFGGLQLMQSPIFNLAPLLALPVLLASVMGSLISALGTAAAVTLLLLTDALRYLWGGTLSEAAPGLLQSALTGMGYFVMAWLAHQLAERLAREERLSRVSQQAALQEQQVSQLVMETLADGVIVVDAHGMARALNPTGWDLLAPQSGLGPQTRPPLPFALSSRTAWQPLDTLARLTLMGLEPQTTDITLQHPGEAPLRVLVRSRVTLAPTPLAENLCLLFLQDLRETEARVRNEKMVAMGRMSTAVAHEIRNPLAAITQANALLQEDLSDPVQKRLSQMIDQNALRLARMVEDILDISRVHPSDAHAQALRVALPGAVVTPCREWSQQTGNGARLVLHALAGHGTTARFDTDHLRRVLVNLLDNASRHASGQSGAIQVIVHPPAGAGVRLDVWSDGPPIEASVEKHLFEPFFSSESRSSGLGLFICRELCDKHGASLSYTRCTLASLLPAGGDGPDALREGNAFYVVLQTTPDASTQLNMPFDAVTP